MAGPSTEYLAEQVDKIRQDIQAVRRDGLDESRRLGDIFADQIQDVRENMVRELGLLRAEVGAGREALKVEQSLICEDLAALKAQTTALVDRFDQTQDLLKQLLFWLLGTIATVGGAVFWKATQAVDRLDDHGRRIEAVERDVKENQVKSRESFDKLSENQARLGASLDRLDERQARLGTSLDKLDANQAKLRESIDQLRKTVDERMIAPPR